MVSSGRTVFGTNSDKVKEKLIMERAIPTLDKATQNESKAATTNDQNKQIIKSTPTKQQPYICGNCGRGHYRLDKYPAKGQICHVCNKRNHFVQVCRSKGRIRRKIHLIDKRESRNIVIRVNHFWTITGQSKCRPPKSTKSKEELFVTVSIH